MEHDILYLEFFLNSFRRKRCLKLILRSQSCKSAPVFDRSRRMWFTTEKLCCKLYQEDFL